MPAAERWFCAGYDIRLVVLDSENFVKWESGESYSVYISTGKVATGTFYFTPPKTDSYYFILAAKSHLPQV